MSNETNSNYFAKYFPNAITILSLCCGLSSIRFSIAEDWIVAVF